MDVRTDGQTGVTLYAPDVVMGGIVKGFNKKHYGISIPLFESKKLKLICDIQTMAALFKLATIPQL